MGAQSAFQSISSPPITDPAMSESLQFGACFFIAFVGDNKQMLVQEQTFILEPIVHYFLNFSV